MPATRTLIAIALAMTVGPAYAEVYKCTDAAGKVTYQQEPCTGGAKGAPVELKTDNAQSQDPGDRDGRWRIAAEQGKVIPGMPKRWVQQALGQPREIRRGTTTENVPEVWVYQTPRGPVRVGFRTNTVEWSRTDAPTGPAAPAPDSLPAIATGAAAGPSVATETARSRVAADRKCDEVLAELGPASKVETTDGSGERPAEARYAYDPAPGGLPLRLSFTCIGGRVTAVSRDITR